MAFTFTIHHSGKSAMEKQQPKFKILMFPWIAYGHIAPYIELSKKLSTTKHFDVYICSTAVNLHYIRATLAKHKFNEESIKLVQLRMPSSPELPPELHTTKNVPPNLVPALIQAFQQSISSFSEIIDSLKPHLLLYDLFQPWAPKIASSKGVPSVHFSTTSLVPFSLLYQPQGTATNMPADSQKRGMEWRNFVQTYVSGAADDFVLGCFARSTDILLVHSCRELEGKFADYLSVFSKKRVVCTGPLIADDSHANLDEEALDIMKWLSGKERSSTVYISFGSECYLSKEQIAEIAKGLELCDVNFIWVLRFPTGGVEEELPAGFIERVGERGRVVKWAPQTNILAHSSVGAFVSHCGWNSTMETVYFGVPVVAIPMQGEQWINARLAVQGGAGVEVERDGGGDYAGIDVAKAIEKTLTEEVSSRAKMLSEKMRKEEEINEAVDELLRICRESNVKPV